MTRIIFDDVDKLIMEKWSEVSELVAAHEAVVEKIRNQLYFVGEELQAWASEQDLEVSTKPKDGEFWAYQKDWLKPSGEDPWTCLAVGGFMVEDAFDGDGGRVYAAVYSLSGKGKQFSKDAFHDTLIAAVGSKQAALWSVDTDRGCPLNRYVEGISARSAFLDSQKFSKLVTEQFNQLLEFVDPISAALKKALGQKSSG